MSVVRLLGIGAVASPWLCACSATFSSGYEGDLRFEHCYRLDEEPSISTARKRACWHRWAHQWSQGEPHDRIEYALARERVLEIAERGGAPEPAPASTAYAALPAPTSAFAPPPRTLAPEPSPNANAPPPPKGFAPSAKAELGTAPGATCGAGCGKEWIDCGQTCRSAACQSACDEHYRSCMRRCF